MTQAMVSIQPAGLCTSVHLNSGPKKSAPSCALNVMMDRNPMRKTTSAVAPS